MTILPLLLALVTSPDVRFSSDVVYAPPGTHATYVDSGWSCRRVVCMTDLGLHVRKDGPDLSVWVTSLTNAVPVSGVHVEAYSRANELLAGAMTGPDGLCRLAIKSGAEPYGILATKGGDCSFITLVPRMETNEFYPGGVRDRYLAPGEAEAFVWTERGIYRHDETIFVQALVRHATNHESRIANHELSLVLVGPRGKPFRSVPARTDASGAVTCDALFVPAQQPSGTWTVQLRLPGKDGALLGERDIRVEEFVPPQIRVKLRPLDETNRYEISAEHLFGGAARSLACQTAVTFEDASFNPKGWYGWSFGDERAYIRPNFVREEDLVTDDSGRCAFSVRYPSNCGRPAEMVMVSVEATVIEDGGRPVTVRRTERRHFYPFYIGSDLPAVLAAPTDGKPPKVRIACVAPDGTALAGVRRLKVTLRCSDRRSSGDAVNFTADTDADGRAEVELPMDRCGSWQLTVADPWTDVAFSRDFWYTSSEYEYAELGGGGRRASLELALDRAVYRAGETPRLTIKSPFAGTALLAVHRDRTVYTEVVALTNATTEIALRPVEPQWAPNVDVTVSVVRPLERASGVATVRVVPPEKVEVAVKCEPVAGREGLVAVEFTAPGATDAAVALVDEGINILTAEPVPDPDGWFHRARTADRSLYDVYNRLLKAVTGPIGRAKMGGGADADLLGRISPQPTRRFRPLALFRSGVKPTNGVFRVVFDVGEFAGELRATALAWNVRAAGAAKAVRKVRPALVMQPDAPRFAAPGDRFETSLHLSADGLETNIFAFVTASGEPGEMVLPFEYAFRGQVHRREILLPVRPAVAWRETNWVERCGAKRPKAGVVRGKNEVTSCEVFESRAGELAAAYRWLADYPHGCLEQTSSRILPLLGVPGKEEFVDAGVRRVVSMIRGGHFVMWPDCDYEPWDKEVSLYASHFLVEAWRKGAQVPDWARERILGFLRSWATSKDRSVAAYACHSLALAGEQAADGMNRLYDERGDLSPLDRARLARAYVRGGDLKRARELARNAASPGSVKEAAFSLLAALEAGEEAPVAALVAYLESHRDRATFAWGTTGDNAHALLALGEYYRRRPAEPGAAFAVWRRLDLPRPEEVRDESNVIDVRREFRTLGGAPADLSNLRRGDLLVVELTLSAAESRWFSDLVVEDLFAAGLEYAGEEGDARPNWVMRYDARDDRMLVFSKRFWMEKGNEVKFRYRVRAVTAGEFALPGVAVEAMYAPAVRARRAPGRVVVRR